MAGQPEFQHKLEAIEELIGRIENAADPAMQAAAHELVELVMELHGIALARTLELLRAGGEPGLQWIDKLGRDDLVSSVLVLQGLHPLSIQERTERAIEKIRPSLKQRGGDVELLSVDGGVPKIKLHANSHAAALKEMVEGAVYQAAPDITSLVIEGPEERAGFVPLDMLRSAPVPQPLNVARNGSNEGGL